jgi:hypothetical protein
MRDSVWTVSIASFPIRHFGHNKQCDRHGSICLQQHAGPLTLFENLSESYRKHQLWLWFHNRAKQHFEVA